MATTAAARAVVVPGPRWSFLGVGVEECARRDGAPVVAAATLPEGGSPPLHVHADLDDSFYVLEGTMVVRCGDDVGLATAGSWVPFPAGVAHTFRVMDGPARILMVHADESFLDFARAVGSPAANRDELDRVSVEHGITNVGPSMSEEEARDWLARLA